MEIREELLGALVEELPPPATAIDAAGRILAPGFIDVHTHAERGLANFPRADNFLLDGVTTVVGGIMTTTSDEIKEQVYNVIKDVGGIPAHGNQRAAWEAGCRADLPNPTHRSSLRDGSSVLWAWDFSLVRGTDQSRRLIFH